MEKISAQRRGKKRTWNDTYLKKSPHLPRFPGIWLQEHRGIPLRSMPRQKTELQKGRVNRPVRLIKGLPASLIDSNCRVVDKRARNASLRINLQRHWGRGLTHRGIYFQTGPYNASERWFARSSCWKCVASTRKEGQRYLRKSLRFLF